MKRSVDELVCEVVARHLDVEPRTITLRTTVDRDLALDALDLVLIAIRIEEMSGIEFPIARLESVRTVADLTKIVRAAHADRFRFISTLADRSRRRTA
jgi:acyl carrier protein